MMTGRRGTNMKARHFHIREIVRRHARICFYVKISIIDFIHDQLKDPIKSVGDGESLLKTRNIFGHFRSENDLEYQVFKRLAFTLRDECDFRAVVG